MNRDRLKQILLSKNPKIIIIKTITGAFLGATLGFAYYRFFGCHSGTCPITGNPYISTIYGAIFGILIFGPLK